MDAVDSNGASTLGTGGPSTSASSMNRAKPFGLKSYTDTNRNGNPTNPPGKNKHQKIHGKGKRGRKSFHAAPDHCSPEDVVARDVAVLLGQDVFDAAVEEGTEWDAPFAMEGKYKKGGKGLDTVPEGDDAVKEKEVVEKEVIEVEIKMMSSNGTYVSLPQHITIIDSTKL
jgi:hypothetical protein